MKTERSLPMLMFLVLGFVLIAPSAQAVQLTPGMAATTPDVFPAGWIPFGGFSPLDSTGTVLGLKSNNTFGIINAQTTTTATGKYVFEAISDPKNVFCSGCVDVIFQLRNDSTSAASLTRVAVSGLSGYLTDVGYDATSASGTGECGPSDSGYCPNTYAPNSVDRLTADVIGFNFDNAQLIAYYGATGVFTSGLTPGNETLDLVIETNAASITDPAGLSIIASDGSSVEGLGQIFVPAGTPVPLPSSVWLLGTGLLGLLGLRRRVLGGG